MAEDFAANPSARYGVVLARVEEVGAAMSCDDTTQQFSSQSGPSRPGYARGLDWVQRLRIYNLEGHWFRRHRKRCHGRVSTVNIPEIGRDMVRDEGTNC